VNVLELFAINLLKRLRIYNVCVFLGACVRACVRARARIDGRALISVNNSQESSSFVKRFYSTLRLCS